jgi:hypothetical protein
MAAAGEDEVVDCVGAGGERKGQDRGEEKDAAERVGHGFVSCLLVRADCAFASAASSKRL